ncbi:hypothetical protein ABFX02_04G224800 [Erythranthe guttata]
MESLSSKILVSSTCNKFPGKYYVTNRRRITDLGIDYQYSPLVVHSKRNSYQDFQEYAKPSRLLRAGEVKLCTDGSFEDLFASPMFGKTESFYKVKLRTSKLYGSGFSDVNSGILLCLIDENGSSILQRLPASSVGSHTWLKEKVVYDTLHFQRGSVDEFAFEGPDLGRIVAVWISVESGQWRIGGMSLAVISPAENNQESKQLSALQYNFEFEDILLGEKSEASMIEFRPRSITAFSKEDDESFDETNSLGSYITSNEESMKEYSYLKFSLLFYDALLILAGSSVSSFSAGEKALYPFLTGGLCGFLYLLLLQRSVDGISTPELVPSEIEGDFGQSLGRLKGPIISLVLGFAFAIAILKYASGDDAVKLTSKDLVFGMMGFLMCKVSVVLAAFKPMPISFGDDK